ncbi:MAG: hypothetical protein M1832_000110 [Thelocarpon impressellum]|nr:MAG: hypothetical protein M1832_000110 [Thelocarpon impressellum]
MHAFSQLAIGLVAVLATGSQAHAPQHGHIHAARGFGNESAPLTTSTIYETSVATITSCAPTVTYCPAESTVKVTSVIAVSTTVCPVSEAGQASAPTPSKPSSDVHVANSTAVGVHTVVGDSTLTYTLGSGESATVVTTTVKVTSTQTLTSSVTVAKAGAPGAEPTTTVKSTSTSTSFVTVSPVGSGQPVANAVAPSGCPAPATVTATVTSVSTVTYTPTFSVQQLAVESAAAIHTPIYNNGTHPTNTTSCISTGVATGTGYITKHVEGAAAPTAQYHKRY